MNSMHFNEKDSTYWRRKFKNCPSDVEFGKLAYAEEVYFAKKDCPESTLAFVEDRAVDGNLVQATDLNIEWIS